MTTIDVRMPDDERAAFLAVVLALRVLYEPGRFAREARSPAALTGVAGTGVLGTAFAVHGYYPVAASLLGLAVVSWALLLTPVLSRWRTPVAGVSFLLTVATQGLAVLGATLAAGNGAAWLLITAVAALILGLASSLAIRLRVRYTVFERADIRISGWKQRCDDRHRTAARRRWRPYAHSATSGNPWLHP